MIYATSDCHHDWSGSIHRNVVKWRNVIEILHYNMLSSLLFFFFLLLSFRILFQTRGSDDSLKLHDCKYNLIIIIIHSFIRSFSVEVNFRSPSPHLSSRTNHLYLSISIQAPALSSDTHTPTTPPFALLAVANLTGGSVTNPCVRLSDHNLILYISYRWIKKINN